MSKGSVKGGRVKRHAPGLYEHRVRGLANGFLVVKHGDFERERAAVGGTSVAERERVR